MLADSYFFPFIFFLKPMLLRRLLRPSTNRTLVKVTNYFVSESVSKFLIFILLYLRTSLDIVDHSSLALGYHPFLFFPALLSCSLSIPFAGSFTRSPLFRPECPRSPSSTLLPVFLFPSVITEQLLGKDFQLSISTPDHSPESWIFMANYVLNVSTWMLNRHLKLCCPSDTPLQTCFGVSSTSQ